MTKKRLIIWIPLAALLVNGLIYFIVSNARPPDQAGSTGLASRSTSDPLAPPLAQERREVPKPETSRTKEAVAQDRQQQQDQRDRDDEKTALARRAIGLAALEAGDYDKALINFTEARTLLGDRAQVGDLLRVTEELRGRPPAAKNRFTKVSPPPSPPAPVAPPPRPVTRAAPLRRVAVKEVPPPVEVSPAPEPPASGTLIVTTTPRGLLVQIDESPIDLTPMRTKVSPGSHRIVLLDGDRRLYDAALVVKEGGTATVLKDLSTEIAAYSKPIMTPAPAPASAPTTPPLAKEEAAPPAMVSAVSREPAKPPRASTRASFSGSGTGALAISSPGLYGVVWVNGRPRGYPPVEIADMPAGPTKVEVRVNGVEKRSSTVVVRPGVTTAVNLRTPEAAP